MTDIICIECKTTVSDECGYCPECGYPFDAGLSDQANVVVSDINNTQQKTVDTQPLEMVLRSLDSVRQEMDQLRETVIGIKHDLDSHSMTSTGETHKILADIAGKLDVITSVTSAKKVDGQADDPKKTKKELLAAFYKTLNSPNSMFEYMFYICVVQIVFVIVNLFLVTYIVTLVR